MKKFPKKNIDEGIETKFAIDRRNMYEKIYNCEEESISKLIQELKTMSTMRIIQILESLVDEEKIYKRFRDGTIYYSVRN